MKTKILEDFQMSISVPLSQFYHKNIFDRKIRMGVLYSLSVKNICYDKIDVTLFLFSCDELFSECE